jgi:RNA polymerase sigma factor (sigma-70 family)
LIQQAIERANLLRTKTVGFTVHELRTKRNGETALSELLDAHRPIICSLVKAYQADRQRVLDPDLEQEAIAAFIDAIQRFDASKGARLGSYAYFRIRASLQDLQTKHNRQAIAVGKSFGETQESTTPEPVDNHRMSLLNAAIALLPERQQQAIRLYLQGLSYFNISERLNLGIRVVQALCYRAKRRLHGLLVPQPPVVCPPSEEAESVAKRWPRSRVPKIFCKARVFFAQTPITPSEAFELPKLSVLRNCPSTVLNSIRITQKLLNHSPGENPMTSYKASRKTAQPGNLLSTGIAKTTSSLTKISQYLLPLWINLGLLSVATYFAHNPLFDCLAITLCFAVFSLYGISKLAQFVSLKLRHRAKAPHQKSALLSTRPFDSVQASGTP